MYVCMCVYVCMPVCLCTHIILIPITIIILCHRSLLQKFTAFFFLLFSHAFLGARLIDPKEPYNRPAIDHLGTLEHLSKAVILLPQATDNPGPYHWPCLPPVPWCMLFWFSLPTSDWEVLASNAGSVMQVPLLRCRHYYPAFLPLCRELLLSFLLFTGACSSCIHFALSANVCPWKRTSF